MRAMRRLRDGRTEVQAAPMARLQSHFGYGVGALWLVGAVVVLSTEPRLSAVLVACGAVFFGIGRLYARATGISIVDPQLRVVIREGEHWTAKELVGVGLGTHIRLMRGKGAPEPQRRWTVWLIERVADLDAVAAQERLRKAAESELSGASRERVLKRLQTWGPYLRGHKVVLTSGPDQQEAWRLGELLGKSFDLPVIDFADEEPVLRSKGKLDQSVSERLREEEQAPDDPGEPPEGITCQLEGDALAVQWKGASGLWINELVFFAFACFGVWGWRQDDDVATFGAIVATAAVAVMLALWLTARGSGANQLRVQDGEVLYETSRPWYHCEYIGLRWLERIRAKGEGAGGLSLITRTRTFQLRVSPEQAQWLAEKLRWFLAQPSRRGEVPKDAPPRA